VLISRRGEWEPEVWDAIRRHLKPGAVFVDVGAHIGIDSLKAGAVVGPSGKVVSIEPNPTTLDQLRANVAASGAKNVIIQPIALADVEQELTLFDSRRTGNSGSSSLSSRNAGDAGRPYKVKGRRLDDVVRELALDRLDLIKADVEGAELLVLRGSVETLTRFRPALILEIVPRQLENLGASVTAVESMIRAFGYNEGQWVDYKNKQYVFSGKR
jgi:FkbM family methyltransferase